MDDSDNDTRVIYLGINYRYKKFGLRKMIRNDTQHDDIQHNNE
jgi:hypothetical protein